MFMSFTRHDIFSTSCGTNSKMAGVGMVGDEVGREPITTGPLVEVLEMALSIEEADKDEEVEVEVLLLLLLELDWFPEALTRDLS